MLTLVIGNKNYSSWSLRPWIAMKQLGLEFDEIRIPLYLPSSKSELLRYSPAGKVPTLLDGDLTLWDTAAILAHLVERYPDKLWWPVDPAARAMARSVSAEMHSSFLALRSHMPMNCRADKQVSGLAATEQTALDGDIARVKQIWQESRSQFGAGGDFLFGQFSIADAMYAPVVWRFKGYNVALDAVEQAYVDAMLALPTMQAWADAGLAETETMADTDNLYPV
jgi:glutathione S-transferase